MLLEIHKSKSSFCEFEDEIYNQQDIILESLEECLFPENIIQAKTNKAARITREKALEYLDTHNKKPKMTDIKIDPNDIEDNGLIFRVHTYEHIPLSTERKKTKKTVADWHVKLNYIPFKHYILEDGQLREVGRSHTNGGEFSDSHGSITDELAKMFVLLVNRYSQKGNWRGYTYNDEMKGKALLQLSEMGLKFNEFRSDNPFSYYTTLVTNAFKRVLNDEKRSQSIRDDLLEEQGQDPSFSRQLDHEEAIRNLREEKQDYE